MRRCDWYGFTTRKEMLAALRDGREDFVIVEDRGKRTEFIQIIRENEKDFFCEIAIDPGEGKERKLLALDMPMSLTQVEGFLDCFESGESMTTQLKGWEEVDWQWREEDSPLADRTEESVSRKECFLKDDRMKKILLLLLALLLAAVLIIIEWKRF